METNLMIYLAVGLLVLIGGLYFYFYQKDKRAITEESGPKEKISVKQVI